jgi:hypothetical protein
MTWNGEGKTGPKGMLGEAVQGRKIKMLILRSFFSYKKEKGLDQRWKTDYIFIVPAVQSSELTVFFGV